MRYLSYFISAVLLLVSVTAGPPASASLSLDTSLSSGFVAGDYEILSLNVDMVTKTCRVTVALYKDAAAFQSGAAAVQTMFFTYAAGKFPFTTDLAGFTAKIEALLMSEKAFIGATQVVAK